MANEVMSGLFGMSPEDYATRRDQQLQQQALQFAQLSPAQQAQMGFYTAGGRLGGAVGGLLGVQDPELMRVKQRQSLLQGIDLNDPAALRERASVAMQQGDVAAASQLAQRAMAVEEGLAKLESERALAAQRTAAANRETTQSIPAEIAKAQRIAALEAAIPVYEQADPNTAKILKAELQALRPTKSVNYGADADRTAKAMFGKTFEELTQQEAKRVDDALEARGVSRASASAAKIVNQLSGVAKAGDVTGLRKDIQAVTRPYQDAIDAAEEAEGLVDLALKTNNFAAVSSLSRSLAKAAGETQLSARDVEAFGVDPSLVGRVTDTVSRLAQGRPTVDTLRQLRQLATVLKKKNQQRLNAEETQLRDTAEVSGLFTPEQIDTVFRRRPTEATNKPKGNQRKTASGVTYTVE